MKKARSAFWVCMAAFILALSSIAASPRGGIRGMIYQDVDGDGQCQYSADGLDRPVPGMTLIFATADTLTNLYTGSDGTYGLVAAGQGDWLVRAAPGAGRWSVLSTNPIALEIDDGGTLIHTDVNFCVRSLGSIGAAAVAETSSSFTQSVSLLREDASTSGEYLPVQDTDPVVSEAILSFVPVPEPAADLTAIVELPVGGSSTPSTEWLAYLNQFREMSGLPMLSENDGLTFGSQAHARYMVLNDKPIAHTERTDNPLFSEAGLQAAQNGNIFSTTQVQAGHEWAINFWMSAPFHLVRVIDPALSEVGYGDYNEAIGNFHMAAVLDVASMIGEVAATQSYPVYFPGDGAVTNIVRHSLYEWPDPTDSCPGYTPPNWAAAHCPIG